MPLELFILDVTLLCGEEIGSGVGALDIKVGPLAAVAFGGGDKGVEVHIAGGGEDHIARAVAGVEILAHLIALQPPHRFPGAEDRVAHGMPPEVIGHDRFEENVRRAIQIKRDFLEDDFFLHVKILSPQRGAHHVREEFENAVGKFRQNLGPVAGDFVAGEGVVLGAHGVEFFIDLVAVALCGAFEHHVFEKMGNAGDGGGLIARPGLDHEAHGGGVGRVVDFGDDIKAIF